MELPDRRSNLPDLRTIGIHPDYWYPVVLARELKPRATLAVSFAGEPVVLARTDTGSVFALEDRCAHRQTVAHIVRCHSI
jgi:phenylpropionate dioxygenase-like ring-hydroxylating dioxygenase large terminal subunit